jgi:hypothetical protein
MTSPGFVSNPTNEAASEGSLESGLSTVFNFTGLLRYLFVMVDKQLKKAFNDKKRICNLMNSAAEVELTVLLLNLVVVQSCGELLFIFIDAALRKERKKRHRLEKTLRKCRGVHNRQPEMRRSSEQSVLVPFAIPYRPPAFLHSPAYHASRPSGNPVSIV